MLLFSLIFNDLEHMSRITPDETILEIKKKTKIVRIFNTV